jgi:hypothetical protein
MKFLYFLILTITFVNANNLFLGRSRKLKKTRGPNKYLMLKSLTVMAYNFDISDNPWKNKKFNEKQEISTFPEPKTCQSSPPKPTKVLKSSTLLLDMNQFEQSSSKSKITIYLIMSDNILGSEAITTESLVGLTITLHGGYKIYQVKDVICDSELIECIKQTDQKNNILIILKRETVNCMKGPSSISDEKEKPVTTLKQSELTVSTPRRATSVAVIRSSRSLSKSVSRNGLTVQMCAVGNTNINIKNTQDTILFDQSNIFLELYEKIKEKEFNDIAEKIKTPGIRLNDIIDFQSLLLTHDDYNLIKKAEEINSLLYESKDLLTKIINSLVDVVQKTEEFSNIFRKHVKMLSDLINDFSTSEQFFINENGKLYTKFIGLDKMSKPVFVSASVGVVEEFVNTIKSDFSLASETSPEYKKCYESYLNKFIEDYYIDKLFYSLNVPSLDVDLNYIRGRFKKIINIYLDGSEYQEELKKTPFEHTRFLNTYFGNKNEKLEIPKNLQDESKFIINNREYFQKALDKLLYEKGDEILKDIPLSKQTSEENKELDE